MSVEKITNLNKIYTPPYTVLATVFDEMMSRVRYKRWAKYVHRILKNENHKKGALLDVGCGTGEFLKYMLKYDYLLSGCDASIGMIEMAKKKLPQLQIHHSVLPCLKEIPKNNYDIVVCLFDTVNYLLDESELIESFQTIYCKMKAPGIFIFDVVTKSYCMQHFQNYLENEVVKKNIAYSRVSEFDANHSIQINYIRIFTQQGVFEEIHKQKIYDLQFLKELIIEKTPFHFVNMLDDFSLQQADQNSGRVHFISKKQ